MQREIYRVPIVEETGFDRVSVEPLEEDLPRREIYLPDEQEPARRRPPPEVFVVRKGKQEKRLVYLHEHCRPLYGSDVQVDSKGNIFYQTWRQVQRERVVPEAFSLLSRTRMGEETYLAQRLVTKKPCELRTNQITKDGGSVEAGIRSVEHGLATELGKEKGQIGMVRERAGELFDLFADFSAVTDDQLEEIQLETYRRLTKVGLDPRTIMLEEKRRMTIWLAKASGGRDILQRKNFLISMMAVEAANRRAIEREQGIGEAASKFARMREALRFARGFSREIFTEVKERLEPQGMPAHYLFKYPNRPANNVGITKGMINHMIWQLTQPPVKPYRPAGELAGFFLGMIVDLLEQDRREEIVKRGIFVEGNLFEEARDILEEVLVKHQSIQSKHFTELLPSLKL